MELNFGEENRLLPGDILSCEDCNKKLVFGEEVINTLLNHKKGKSLILCAACFKKRIDTKGLVKIILADPTKPIEYHKI